MDSSKSFGYLETAMCVLIFLLEEALQFVVHHPYVIESWAIFNPELVGHITLWISGIRADCTPEGSREPSELWQRLNSFCVQINNVVSNKPVVTPELLTMFSHGGMEDRVSCDHAHERTLRFFLHDSSLYGMLSQADGYVRVARKALTHTDRSDSYKIVRKLQGPYYLDAGIFRDAIEKDGPTGVSHCVWAILMAWQRYEWEPQTLRTVAKDLYNTTIAVAAEQKWHVDLLLSSLLGPCTRATFGLLTNINNGFYDTPHWIKKIAKQNRWMDQPSPVPDGVTFHDAKFDEDLDAHIDTLREQIYNNSYLRNCEESPVSEVAVGTKRARVDGAGAGAGAGN